MACSWRPFPWRPRPDRRFRQARLRNAHPSAQRVSLLRRAGARRLGTRPLHLAREIQPVAHRHLRAHGIRAAQHWDGRPARGVLHEPSLPHQDQRPGREDPGLAHRQRVPGEEHRRARVLQALPRRTPAPRTRPEPPARGAGDSTRLLRGESDCRALVPFYTRGAGPHRTLANSPTLRIVGLTDFVSNGRVGGILTACLSSTPCHATTTLSVGHTVIARTGGEFLGANEL